MHTVQNLAVSGIVRICQQIRRLLWLLMFFSLVQRLGLVLSFLRIGVFAISHAAMMQVVMTLAGAENGGSANIFVVIIGNIIVLAMEGLVVGIQVLRLEYYEIFGRFYEGSGREFVPYRKKYKK